MKRQVDQPVTQPRRGLSGGRLDFDADHQPHAAHLADTRKPSGQGIQALGKLSSGSKKFSIQVDFSQKLSDALTGGIGNLVDANMATESAQLQALQIKQQLGVQALSIANQAPQVVLQLFK